MADFWYFSAFLLYYCNCLDKRLVSSTQPKSLRRRRQGRVDKSLLSKPFCPHLGVPYIRQAAITARIPYSQVKLALSLPHLPSTLPLYSPDIASQITWPSYCSCSWCSLILSLILCRPDAAPDVLIPHSIFSGDPTRKTEACASLLFPSCVPDSSELFNIMTHKGMLASLLSYNIYP